MLDSYFRQALTIIEDSDLNVSLCHRLPLLSKASPRRVRYRVETGHFQIFRTLGLRQPYSEKIVVKRLAIHLNRTAFKNAPPWNPSPLLSHSQNYQDMKDYFK